MINNEKIYIARNIGCSRIKYEMKNIHMKDKIIKFSFHAYLLLVNNESRNYEYFLIYVTRIAYYIT